MSRTTYASAPQVARWLDHPERSVRRRLDVDAGRPPDARVFPGADRSGFAGWWRVPVATLVALRATPADPTLLDELEVAGLAGPQPVTHARDTMTPTGGTTMPSTTLTQARQDLKALQDQLPAFLERVETTSTEELRLRRARVDLDELSTAKTRATAATDLLEQLQSDIAEAAALVDDLERQAEHDRRAKAAAATLATLRETEAEYVNQLGDLLDDLCQHAVRLNATRERWRTAARAASDAHAATGAQYGAPGLTALTHARAAVPADFLALAPKKVFAPDAVGTRPREEELALTQLPDFLRAIVVAIDAGATATTTIPDPKEHAA